VYEGIADPYCYKGTTVLKNRLNLISQHELDAFEADAVTQRGLEPLPQGRFTPTHFRAVHRHLFQDVYPWAGRYRTVRISKGGSMFCYPENIASQLQSLFEWLGHQNRLSELDNNSFSEVGAHFLSELNAIHAFREGNGRAQMALFAMLANSVGHRLNLSLLDPAPFLAAMIAAFDGNERHLSEQVAHLIG
jgi:cell filamentation protein